MSRRTRPRIVEPEAVRRPYNRLLAHLSEAAAPAIRFIAAHWVAQATTPPSEWRRLVVTGASHIGDVLYRTPSLPVLRRELPRCHITYVCAPETAELLTTNPHVDEVLPLWRDAGWRHQPETRAAFRERQFDAVLCTDHIAYHRDLLLATAFKIPNRVGFVHRGLSALLTFPSRGAYPRPAPAYMRALVAAITGQPDRWSLVPQVFPRAADETAARTVWEELGLGPARPVVACALTTRQKDTAVWPAERYLATVAAAVGGPVDVLLCGSRDDADLLAGVAAAAPPSVRCHVVAGRLGLNAFACLLKRCDAVLASDSGARHLANAVGTPVVFIRNLRVSRIETGAYCDNETDVAPGSLEFLSLDAQQRAMDALRVSDVAPVLAAACARSRRTVSAPSVAQLA